MIDLTPLDVRNKRGDFKKGMRGYDPQEVDVFLELVAERLEALVRENIQLKDRTRTLQEQVDAQVGREKAVQDALVTAQELRKDIREQSQREADHLMREAETEAKRMIAEAEGEARARLRGVERQMDQARASLQELERRRHRFLQDFRALLERELDNVEVEAGRTPLEHRPIDMELGAKEVERGEDVEEAPLSKQPEESVPGETDAESLGAGGAAPSDQAESSAGPGASGESPHGSTARSASSGEPGSSVEGGPSVESAAPTESPSSAASGTPATSTASSEGATSGDVRGHGAPADLADVERRAPEPEIDDAPSSLEVELMAGAVGEDGPTHPDVPDLETVLAEAGIDGEGPDGEAHPPAEEISPPPVDHDAEDRKPEDRLALFDKDEKKKKKRR